MVIVLFLLFELNLKGICPPEKKIDKKLTLEDTEMRLEPSHCEIVE